MYSHVVHLVFDIMITFRQFLYEVEIKRSVTQAKKLFLYHAGRKLKYGKDVSYAIHPRTHEHVYTKNIIPPFHDYPDYRDADERELEGGKIENIPVKKIRSHQLEVDIEAMPGKISKKPIYPDIPEYPEVVYNHVHDIYHLKDGNHRVAAALYRRDKNIKAKVWYMKKRRE